MNIIPKIIHQTWKNNDIPDDFKISINRWKQLHPNYKYILWTDKTMEKFMKKNYSWFLNTYNNYKYNIQKCDAWRYFVLYHYGGIYSDLDIIPKKKITEIDTSFHNYDAIIPITSNQNIFSSLSLTNSFMCSKKNSDLFETLIFSLKKYKNKCKNFLPHAHIMCTAGPFFLSDVIKKKFGRMPSKKNNILIIPENIFNPGFGENNYFSHLKGGTWHNWDNKILNIMQKYQYPSIFTSLLLLIISGKMINKNQFLIFKMFVKNLDINQIDNLSSILGLMFYQIKKNSKRLLFFHKNVNYIEKYTGKKINKITSLSNSIKFMLLGLWIDYNNISTIKLNKKYSFDSIKENAIYITSHSTNNILLPIFAYYNIKHFTIYKKPAVLVLEKFTKKKNKFLYEFMKSFESLDNNIEILYIEGNTTGKCLDALSKGKNIFIFCDRNIKKGKKKIKFLGKEIHSPWYTVSKLHYLSQKPVIPIFSKRNKNIGEIEIKYRILNATSIQEMEGKICKYFEENILENLDDWNLLSPIWCK